MSSPLAAALGRYADYFALFENFKGYVEFFLLADLASGDELDFFLPFKSDFSNPALPQTVEDYHQYMANSMRFVAARNQRILRWSRENL
jgi:hypothetical protein